MEGKESRQQGELQETFLGKVLGKSWRRRGTKSRGAQGQSWAGAIPVPDLAPHTAAPSPQDAQHTLCTGQGSEGEAKKQKKKGRGQRALTRLQSSAGRGDLSQASPSSLREPPCSSRGGKTAGAKEDKIPAGLHTHSGAGGKAAQSRDLGVQRGRMQGCQGGSPGMVWACCGHCSLAQRKQQ